MDIAIVDIFGNVKGSGEKIDIHKKGILHSAFSVFIIKNNKMLLQKRAKNKYHSGGLWSNACCSHQNTQKNFFENVKDKVHQELGINAINIKHEFSFIYRAKFDNGLIEYEYDDVLTCDYIGDIKLNLEEAESYAWIDLNTLSNLLISKPEKFTAWFLICAPQIIKKYLKKS